MRTQVPLEQMQELLARPLLAVLATRREDGETLLSPVWHEWADGGFTIVIGADDRKARQLRRDPRCTVLVAEQVEPYRSVELRGRAVLSQPSDVRATARRIAIRYLGAEAGEAYADALAGSALLQLRLADAAVRSWDFLDEFRA